MQAKDEAIATAFASGEAYRRLGTRVDVEDRSEAFLIAKPHRCIDSFPEESFIPRLLTSCK